MIFILKGKLKDKNNKVNFLHFPPTFPTVLRHATVSRNSFPRQFPNRLHYDRFLPWCFFIVRSRPVPERRPWFLAPFKQVASCFSLSASLIILGEYLPKPANGINSGFFTCLDKINLSV